MSIGDEAAAIRAEIEYAKKERLSVIVRIDGDIQEAKTALSKSALKKLDQIDVDGAFRALQHAVKLKAELKELEDRIYALEREMG